MSIHGECFDNGQSGNCGYECQLFVDGECSVQEEVREALINDLHEMEHRLSKYEQGAK